MQPNSRAASAASNLGIAGVIACALGPLLVQFGLIAPLAAFMVFAVGLLLGLLALLLGVVALWLTRAAAGVAGRPRALLGVLLGALLFAIAASAVGSARDLPRINDITTNPSDPPEFHAAQTDPANAGRDLAYPGTGFATAQRAGYPDLEPLRVAAARDAVYARALTAAEALGWQITQRDPANASFEAVDVSQVFRFVDDIAVRVRAAGAGSIVDVRSKSRDGKGDMGANAARIRAFAEALGT